LAESSHEARHFSGLVFVACMFIGAGLGLLFNRPEVGGAIGMGVGFLLMGFIRIKNVKPTPVTTGLPRTLPSLSLTAAGIIVMLAGVSIIFKPEWLYPYLAGLVIIVIGLIIFVGGMAGLKRKAEA